MYAVSRATALLLLDKQTAYFRGKVACARAIVVSFKWDKQRGIILEEQSNTRLLIRIWTRAQVFPPARLLRFRASSSGPNSPLIESRYAAACERHLYLVNHIEHAIIFTVHNIVASRHFVYVILYRDRCNNAI